MDSEKSVLIRDEYDIVNARSTGKQMAAEVGLGLIDQSRVATAVSELARNVVVYAGSGVVSFQYLTEEGRCGLEIMVVDNGPGIDDIELAMRDGYTSGGGLGVGLPGTKRLMDELPNPKDREEDPCPRKKCGTAAHPPTRIVKSSPVDADML